MALLRSIRDEFLIDLYHGVAIHCVVIVSLTF